MTKSLVNVKLALTTCRQQTYNFVKRICITVYQAEKDNFLDKEITSFKYKKDNFKIFVSTWNLVFETFLNHCG